MNSFESNGQWRWDCNLAFCMYTTWTQHARIISVHWRSGYRPLKFPEMHAVSSPTAVVVGASRAPAASVYKRKSAQHPLCSNKHSNHDGSNSTSPSSGTSSLRERIKTGVSSPNPHRTFSDHSTMKISFILLGFALLGCAGNRRQ